MMALRYGLVLLMVFFGTGCQPQQIDQASMGPIDTRAVRQEKTPAPEVFEAQCSMCHSSGAPLDLAHFAPASSYLKTPEGFEAFLRKPPPGGMPAFGPAQITHAEAQQLYEYLRKAYPQ